MSFEIGSMNVKFPEKTEDEFPKEIFRKLPLLAYDNEPVDHIIDRINFEIVRCATSILLQKETHILSRSKFF